MMDNFIDLIINQVIDIGDRLLDRKNDVFRFLQACGRDKVRQPITERLEMIRFIEKGFYVGYISWSVKNLVELSRTNRFFQHATKTHLTGGTTTIPR